MNKTVEIGSVLDGLNKSETNYTDCPLSLIDDKQSFNNIDSLSDLLFMLNKEFDKFSFVISIELRKSIDPKKSVDIPSIIKQGSPIKGSESIYIFKRGYEFWTRKHKTFKFQRITPYSALSNKYDLLYSTLSQNKSYVRALWIVPWI